MDELFKTFRMLARKFDARWHRIDDVLTRVRAHEGSGLGDGTRSRNILLNAFCTQVPVDKAREALELDRANALKKLGKPLSTALAQIITIELANAMLEELDRVETDQLNKRAASEREEKNQSHYAGLIDALYRAGVPRGAYSALEPSELGAVVRYVRKKVDKRSAALPPMRLGQKTHGENGRLHMFWDSWELPRDPR